MTAQIVRQSYPSSSGSMDDAADALVADFNTNYGPKGYTIESIQFVPTLGLGVFIAFYQLQSVL